MRKKKAKKTSVLLTLSCSPPILKGDLYRIYRMDCRTERVEANGYNDNTWPFPDHSPVESFRHAGGIVQLGCRCGCCGCCGCYEYVYRVRGMVGFLKGSGMLIVVVAKMKDGP